MLASNWRINVPKHTAATANQPARGCSRTVRRRAVPPGAPHPSVLSSCPVHIRDQCAAQTRPQSAVDLSYARPVRIRFQYSAGRPRRLRYHMSRRSWVVSINGIEGAGFMV